MNIFERLFGAPSAPPQSIGEMVGGAAADPSKLMDQLANRERTQQVTNYMLYDSPFAEIAQAPLRGLQTFDNVAMGRMPTHVANEAGEMVPNPQMVSGMADLAGSITVGAGFVPGGGLRAGASFVDDIADPVVARGSKIMDMLKSGRGKAITDDMLDMGDDVANARLNAWLYENYDLPMDQASRMARADAMGFDNATPTYHAGHEGFPAVDLRRSDTGMSIGTGERAFWTTTDPKTADTYLAGAWVKDAPGNEGAPIGDGVLRYYTPGAQIMPTMNKVDNLDVWDMGGGAYPPGGLSKEIKSARKDKMDGVAFQRMKDQGVMGLGSGNAKNTSIATIKPNAVRSANARFDPRLAHLRNLSAGVAGGLSLFPLVGEMLSAEDRNRS